MPKWDQSGTTREQIARVAPHRDYGLETPRPHGGDVQPARPKQASLVDITVELETVERHARWMDAVKKIGGGVTVLAVFVGTVYSGARKGVELLAEKQFDGFVARFDPAVIALSDEEVKRLEKRGIKPQLIDERFAAMAAELQRDRESFAALAQQVDAGQKRAQAWDQAWRKRYPQRANVTPMPALGPTIGEDKP